MKTSELDYELPEELIAQHPAARRDESRLLVYSRATGEVRHRVFRDLPEELPPDTLAVVNDTRVVPARIPIESPRGEVLLLERARRRRVGGARPADAAAARRPAVRPGRAARAPRRGPLARCGSTARPAGEVPLPPYIHEPLADAERYQTVYAREEGSAAAPTAGLHFTPELLGAAAGRARHAARRARHLPAADGGDASRSTRSTASATRCSRRRGSGSRAASACSPSARRRCGCSRRSPAAAPLAGRTELFVTPGFEFRRVDCLLTNFHLPRSTLLALVMAFAGVEETRRLYRLAVEERYRFYSFGDAMLIL